MNLIRKDIENMKELTLFTTMFKSSWITELECQSMDLRVYIDISLFNFFGLTN